MPKDDFNENSTWDFLSTFHCLPLNIPVDTTLVKKSWLYRFFLQVFWRTSTRQFLGIFEHFTSGLSDRLTLGSLRFEQSGFDAKDWIADNYSLRRECSWENEAHHIEVFYFFCLFFFALIWVEAHCRWLKSRPVLVLRFAVKIGDVVQSTTVFQTDWVYWNFHLCLVLLFLQQPSLVVRIFCANLVVRRTWKGWIVNT